MKDYEYTFNFKGGQITVRAMNLEVAKICAKAEAIRNGWDYTIIDEHCKAPKSTPLVYTPIDNALMFIIEMEDVDSLDEQLDCIEALKRLRNKLKEKENA